MFKSPKIAQQINNFRIILKDKSHVLARHLFVFKKEDHQMPNLNMRRISNVIVKLGEPCACKFEFST